MGPSFVRYWVLRAFEGGLKRRKSFSYLKELERTQWLSPHEIDEIQFAGLRRLISHAFQSCEYYRGEWNRLGLHPAQLTSFEAFRQWPVTSRETIRTHRVQMRTGAPRMPLIAKATGGSSGVSLQFDIDHGNYERRLAATYRGYAWAGAGPGTKQLYLWGVPLGPPTRWKRCKDALYNRVNGRRVLNAFELSDGNVSVYHQRIQQFRPDVIVGYTNPLYTLARALDERELPPFSPRAIIVGAEKLHPFQRSLIEKVFAAPVFETYGSREFTLIGAECPRHEGLHLTQEHLFVEVLDDDGQPTRPGDEGNIVITDLYNYGMPFIRYTTGDRAVAGWGSCSCGRGLPLLRKVVGRRLDVLHTPDGRRIPGEFFPHLLKDFPAVTRYQVVQERPDCVQLRAILKETWSAADRGLLENEVRNVLGPAVRFEFLPVAEIPLTAAGKLQVVVNRCPAVAGSMPPGAIDSESF